MLGSLMVHDSLKLGRRILDLADVLAHWSESSGALTCTFFSDAHRAVAKQLRDWFAATGLASENDPIGNVVGRIPGSQPGARTVILGSHYDTVRNAGKYDGRLGILCALVVLETLRSTRLPFAIELIAFSEEEGVRFATPYLGSRAVVGRLDGSTMNVRDRSGNRLGDVIAAAGYDLDQLPSLARDPEEIMAYLEVHIEQGPVLLNESLPVAIVTTIAGDIRCALAIEGEPGHAGTVPMNARRDALLAAAEIALFVEHRALAEAGVLGTVGRLEVPEGAINVIPKRCELSLDLRAQDEGVLAQALADILAESEAITKGRGVRLSAHELLRAKPVPCAQHLQHPRGTYGVPESGRDQCAGTGRAGRRRVPEFRASAKTCSACPTGSSTSGRGHNSYTILGRITTPTSDGRRIRSWERSSRAWCRHV